MRDDEIDEVVAMLLRRTAHAEGTGDEGVVPMFSVAKYVRESAALAATTLPAESASESVESARVLAAFVRAAFGSDEDDVRAAAQHALILRGSELGDVVHFALLSDEDPYVRESAFEEAQAVNDDSRRLRLLRRAVAVLVDDECEFVRETALEFKLKVGSVDEGEPPA